MTGLNRRQVVHGSCVALAGALISPVRAFAAGTIAIDDLPVRFCRESPPKSAPATRSG